MTSPYVSTENVAITKDNGTYRLTITSVTEAQYNAMVEENQTSMFSISDVSYDNGTVKANCDYLQAGIGALLNSALISEMFGSRDDILLTRTALEEHVSAQIGRHVTISG